VFEQQCPFALFKIILQKLTKSPLAMVYFQSEQNNRLLHIMSTIASPRDTQTMDC